MTTFASLKVALNQNDGQLSKTVGYYLSFIALGLVVATLGPTLQDLANNAKVSLADASILFTMGSLGYLIGSLLSGRIFDRMTGHKIIVGTLLMLALLLTVIPLLTSLPLLILAFLLVGMSNSGIDVGGNTLIVWVHGKDANPYLNGLHFFFGVGAFFAPIIISQMILLTDTVTGAYWALAILMLPTAIWLVRLPSPPIRTQENKGSTEHPPIDYKLVGLLTLLLTLYAAAESSYGGWIFSYATELDFLTKPDAALLTSLFWGSLTVGRLVGVPLSSRFSGQTIILMELLGSILSAALALAWSNVVILWISVGFMGFAMASVFPLVIGLAEEKMRLTGTVTSMFFAGASAGSMVMPWIIGRLFESIGPRVLMWATLIDIAASVGIFVLLNLYTRRTAEVQPD